IIVGTVVGGLLINPTISEALLAHSWINAVVQTRTEAAILLIGLVYLAAALTNLAIPRTNVTYPRQERNPAKLIAVFAGYVRILWNNKLGQISLAVTNLFWGAGATLQFIVIEWGAQHQGYRLDQSSILMGVAAIGTVFGAVLAGRVPLRRALSVLPIGILMGLAVMLMPMVHEKWAVYTLLLVVGGLSGYFVVPMNALLQHRGHVL